MRTLVRRLRDGNVVGLGGCATRTLLVECLRDKNVAGKEIAS